MTSSVPRLALPRSRNRGVQSKLVVQGIDRRNLARTPGDVVLQFVVLCGIHLGLLIIIEALLGLPQSAGIDVPRSFGLPLLDRIIVEEPRDKEGLLKFRLRVRMTEIVSARS